MGQKRNGDLRHALHSFLKQLQAHYDLERVILFGSRAQGEPLKHSDYDLLVVSNDFKDIPFFERMNDILLMWKHTEDIEVLCYTQQEFEKKKKQIGIVATAVQEGITLYP